MQAAGPIGVFDSGYGGLTVFKEIARALPQYDFIYLGDNARVPYGNRSFETVYKYTLECVNHLFEMNCNLVILACNTASAKALRSIQQNDLTKRNDYRRVLGVIRPTAEVLGNYSKSGQVGIFATQGTVTSESYIIEAHKQFPELNVTQEACPMWVPLVENNEFDTPGADYFVKKHIHSLLHHAPNIDTILLACTHYPLLEKKIRQFLPTGIQLLGQGEIVASSLKDYLYRHPEMEELCTKSGHRSFFTTESTADFDRKGKIFLGEDIQSKHLEL